MPDEITTEMQCAEAIARGDLPSPQNWYGSLLFAIRFSGTGCAYREAHAELCWRDPAIWLNPEMCARCTGIPVLIGHPEKGILSTKEFAARCVGLTMLCYVKDDSLFAIMRVLDRDAAAALVDVQYDSSPAVLFSKDSNNATATLPDGTPVLIEGKPSLVDHLGIVPQGVWSKKGAEPPGVEVSSQQKELENA